VPSLPTQRTGEPVRVRPRENPIDWGDCRNAGPDVYWNPDGGAAA
jgi:hypothetical protein